MNKRTITIDQLIREEYLKIQKQNYIKNLIQEVTTKLREQEQPDFSVNINTLPERYTVKTSKLDAIQIKDINLKQDRELLQIIFDVLQTKLRAKQARSGNYMSSKEWIRDRDVTNMIAFDIEGKRIKINPDPGNISSNFDQDSFYKIGPASINFFPTTVKQLSPDKFDPILFYDENSLKSFITNNPGVEQYLSDPLTKKELMNNLGPGKNFNIQTLLTNITMVPVSVDQKFYDQEKQLAYDKYVWQNDGTTDFSTFTFAPKSNNSNIIIRIPNAIFNTRTTVKDQPGVYFDVYVELSWNSSWSPPELSTPINQKKKELSDYVKEKDYLKKNYKKTQKALKLYAEFMKSILEKDNDVIINVDKLNVEDLLKYSDRFQDKSPEGLEKLGKWFIDNVPAEIFDFFAAGAIDATRWITMMGYYILIDPFVQLSKDPTDIDAWQSLADLAGWIPAVGDYIDLVNGFVYLGRGKWVDAGLSFLAAIPIIGSPIAKSIKIGSKVTKSASKGAKAVKFRKILKVNRKTYKELANTPNYKRIDKIIQGLGITPKQTEKLQKLYKKRLDKGDYEFITDYHYWALANDIKIDPSIINLIKEAQQIGNFTKQGITKLEGLQKFLNNLPSKIPGKPDPAFINYYIDLLTNYSKEADNMNSVSRLLVKLMTKTDDVIINSTKMKVIGSGKVIKKHYRIAAVQAAAFKLANSLTLGVGINFIYGRFKWLDKVISKRQFVDLSQATRKAYGQWLRKNKLILAQEIIQQSRKFEMPAGIGDSLKQYAKQTGTKKIVSVDSMNLPQLGKYLEWAEKNNKTIFRNIIGQVSGGTQSKRYAEWVINNMGGLFGGAKKSLLLAQEAYQQKNVRGLFNSIFSIKGLDVASNEVQDLLNATGISTSNNDEENMTQYQGLFVASFVKTLQADTYNVPLLNQIPTLSDTPMNQTLNTKLKDLPAMKQAAAAFDIDLSDPKYNMTVLDELRRVKAFNQENISPTFDYWTNEFFNELVQGFPKVRSKIDKWYETNKIKINQLTEHIPGFESGTDLEGGGYIIQSDVIEQPSKVINRSGESLTGGNPMRLVKNPHVSKGTVTDPFIYYGIFGEYVFKPLSIYSDPEERKKHFMKRSANVMAPTTYSAKDVSIKDQYSPPGGGIYTFLQADPRYPNSGRLEDFTKAQFKTLVQYGCPSSAGISFRCQLYLAGPPSDEQINALTNYGGIDQKKADLLIQLKKLLAMENPRQEDMNKLYDLITSIDPTLRDESTLGEQDFPGPFGKEHDYSDYGGPWGTGHHHKTKFKKGPGKNPTDSISSDRGEEEAEDDRITGYRLVNEDPKKGTGKKPKGSSRRLYTDENPKDTVSVKFKTRQDVSDTLNKSSFKSKSHARQSQIINLIHQRLRVAIERTKDPEKKKRLKAAYDYIKKKKEASKEKTKRLNKENFADGKNPGRKGLSQRVGIPKNATIAQLEKAAKADGEKGRLARWQLNMRRGKKKKK